MATRAMEPRVAWAAIDLLPLRGNAQLVHHVVDAVEGSGEASGLTSTTRHELARGHSLSDGLRYQGNDGNASNGPLCGMGCH